MSTGNILKTEQVGKKLRVDFETRSGEVVQYDYSARAAKSIKNGKDPADYRGKRVEHERFQENDGRSRQSPEAEPERIYRDGKEGRGTRGSK